MPCHLPLCPHLPRLGQTTPSRFHPKSKLTCLRLSSLCRIIGQLSGSNTFKQIAIDNDHHNCSKQARFLVCRVSIMDFSSLDVKVLLRLTKFLDPVDRFNLVISGILKGFENANEGIDLRERYSKLFILVQCKW